MPSVRMIFERLASGDLKPEEAIRLIQARDVRLDCDNEEHYYSVTRKSTLDEECLMPNVPRSRTLAKPLSAVGGQWTGNGVRENVFPSDSIAIIGRAGQMPDADGVDEFWANLLKSKVSIAPVPDRCHLSTLMSTHNRERMGFRYQLGSLRSAGYFDSAFFNVSREEAYALDPQQRTFLEACYSCIEDAAVSTIAIREAVCGVFVGCGRTEYGYPPTRAPKFIDAVGTAPSVLASRIAHFLGLSGPCVAIDTACSSSLVAISQACDSLVLGRTDYALAGGVCIVAGPSLHAMVDEGGLMSASGRCAPFDYDADGYVLGEAVGVLLLRRLTDAVRDRDPIRGVIRGWGSNHNGRTNGITAPSAYAQTMLLQNVYRTCGVSLDSISFIEAHGNGTRIGDAIELHSLHQVFGDRAGELIIGSVKGNIGYSLTAAGIAGVLKTLSALEHKTIPATANHRRFSSEFTALQSKLRVSIDPVEWIASQDSPRRAGVSAFGFSGVNSHIVIEEYPQHRSPLRASPGVLLLPISAKTDASLHAYAKKIQQSLAENPASAADLVYTFQIARERMRLSLIVAGRNANDLIRGIQQYLDNKRVCRESEGECECLSDNGYTMYPPAHSGCATGEMPVDLLSAWREGRKVDWLQLYGTDRPHRVHGPTYPFDRQYYWRY